MEEYISNNEQDTKEIALQISRKLTAGDIVLLEGDLGAGKTAFVKGIIKAYGGDESQVTSPTFTIVNEYNVLGKTIYHFDLYRIESVEELFNIGIEEYFYSVGICFIEWPERAEELFVGSHKKITIEKTGETSRKIKFEEIE
ncbi:MAG: tRNA (adenosine(37)-N6)-threonylcarbamoyltransferase complex ATPase subunit type 1 TsaE [Clostridia bacterium]|nr:tRNA (adenosine(37)-N6)-threonylcarbamoyltransferase complex ATPase subunit type 1 TsaE [Clostridia bacterium]